ncbi:MAG: FecR domain-containing protein [bacterium]
MDESFQRWINGTASDKEKEKWSKWLDKDPSHRRTYAEALEIWQLSQFVPSPVPDIEQELFQLNRRIDAMVQNVAVDRRFSLVKYRFKPWLRRPLLAGVGAFALVILLFAVMNRNLLFEHSVKSNNNYHTVSTDFGQRTRITLPEGTVVIVNANSALYYPAAWTVKTARRLRLEGEAFFDVAETTEKTQQNFVVYTKDGAIEVTGTRFVVYERGNGTRVIVKDGNVRVTPGKFDKNDVISTESVLLHSGEMVEFRKNDHRLISQKQNTGVHTSWWHEYLKLDNAPFEEIIRRIEETYGIQIIVEDDALKGRTLSGSIENQNLDVIINGIARALDLNIQKNGNLFRFSRVAPHSRNR